MTHWSSFSVFQKKKKKKKSLPSKRVSHTINDSQQFIFITLVYFYFHFYLFKFFLSNIRRSFHGKICFFFFFFSYECSYHSEIIIIFNCIILLITRLKSAIHHSLSVRFRLISWKWMTSIEINVSFFSDVVSFSDLISDFFFLLIFWARILMSSKLLINYWSRILFFYKWNDIVHCHCW